MTSAPASDRAEERAVGGRAQRAAHQVLAEIRARLDELATLATPAPVEGLVLDQVDCTRLDERLGLGSTQNAIRLIAAIDRLASIRIGDIRIPFTPGQLAELHHRAEKRGRTVEQEMKAVVARIEEELFYRGG